MFTLRYPLRRRQDGPQSRSGPSGRYGEEMNPFASAGNRTQIPLVIRPVVSVSKQAEQRDCKNMQCTLIRHALAGTAVNCFVIIIVKFT